LRERIPVDERDLPEEVVAQRLASASFSLRVV
jgi:hypothetical protein